MQETHAIDGDGMVTRTDSQNRRGTAVGLEAIVGPGMPPARIYRFCMHALPVLHDGSTVMVARLTYTYGTVSYIILRTRLMAYFLGLG